MKSELTPLNQPPAHVAALLQQEGMSYDPTAFASMTLEQHTDEGFKGLRVSVLAAVYSGMHFSQAIEKFKQQKELELQANEDSESPKRLGDFKSAKQYILEQADKNNVGYQSIYNMIATYELFARSPEPVLQVFSRLDYTKLLEFKRFEQADLEALAEGQEVYGVTLESVQNCSVRDLKATIKENLGVIAGLRQKVAKLEEDNSKAWHEKYKAAQALSQLTELPKEHIHLSIYRQQVLADCELIYGAIQRIGQTFEGIKNMMGQMEHDAKNWVAFPAIHELDAITGLAIEQSKLFRGKFGIMMNLPVNPPALESLNNDEFFCIAEAARYRKDMSDKLEIRLKDATKCAINQFETHVQAAFENKDKSVKAKKGKE